MNKECAIAQAKEEEWKRIQRDTAVERDWWKPSAMFASDTQARQALDRRELVALPPVHPGLKLIGILNSSEGGEPNWIRPGTWHYIGDLVAEWMHTNGYTNISLAVTSVGRTAEIQKKLCAGEQQYRASKPMQSAHIAGAAVDLSLRSYYRQTENGFQSVTVWHPETGFNGDIPLSFLETVRRLQKSDAFNICVEHMINEQGSTPSVLYICVSPNTVRQYT